MSEEKITNKEHHDRRRFLKLAGATGGSASLALFLAACGSSKKTATAATATSTTAGTSSTSSNTSDLGILNYALTLEYLETAFYSSVVASGLLKGKEQDLAKQFGATEATHVTALTAAIKQFGGMPVGAPKASFPLKDRLSVLKLAATVENLGAAAYLGQAGNIQSPEVLASALAIHSVEARHAAALNDLLGLDPTPNGAFAVPASKEQVLAAVAPFIAS